METIIQTHVLIAMGVGLFAASVMGPEDPRAEQLPQFNVFALRAAFICAVVSMVLHYEVADLSLLRSLGLSLLSGALLAVVVTSVVAPFAGRSPERLRGLT